ncbi:hypothetical protein D3C76_1798660 [compost metagenome]
MGKRNAARLQVLSVHCSLCQLLFGNAAVLKKIGDVYFFCQMGKRDTARLHVLSVHCTLCQLLFGNTAVR